MVDIKKNDAPCSRSRLTFVGYSSYLKSIRKVRKLFRSGEDLQKIAIDCWEIDPGDTTVSSAAFFLPGQLDKVTGMAYTNNPAQDMLGGIVRNNAPTRGIVVRDVWLLNGALYKGITRFDLYSRTRLSKRQRYLPPIYAGMQVNSASIYSSWDGHEFFGLWLTDDCSTYLLASNDGVPVTSNHVPSSHMIQYEQLLSMSPVRTEAAYLKEVVFYDDDWGYGESKHKRFSLLKRKLIERYPGNAHSGVFILRRSSGKPRILQNEMEIAQALQNRYGFRIVDVTQQSVHEILSACAGARVIIGIEGSHLMHGLMMLQAGGSLLALQPPDRFCGVLKLTTDMEGQNYGFVVGSKAENGFVIDLDDVERTLDMMAK